MSIYINASFLDNDSTLIVIQSMYIGVLSFSCSVQFIEVDSVSYYILCTTYMSIKLCTPFTHTHTHTCLCTHTHTHTGLHTEI